MEIIERDNFDDISEDIKNFVSISSKLILNFNKIDYVIDRNNDCYYTGFVYNDKLYKLKDSAKKEEFDKLYNLIELYIYYTTHYIETSVNDIIDKLLEIMVSTAKQNPFMLKNVIIREYCSNIFFSLHVK